jgi:hypothetical protein
MCRSLDSHVVKAAKSTWVEIRAFPIRKAGLTAAAEVHCCHADSSSKSFVAAVLPQMHATSERTEDAEDLQSRRESAICMHHCVPRGESEQV